MSRVWILPALALALPSGIARAQDARSLGDPLPVPDAPPDLAVPLPPDLALDAQNLDGWLTLRSERAEGARVEGSVWQIVLGSVSLGLGLWLTLDTSTFGPVPGAGGIGALAIGTGVTGLGLGIYGLTAQSFDHERRARWRHALAGGLTERELGRFEGELRAEAELARFLRMADVVGGLVNVGAGIAAILTTALGPMDDLSQITGYTVGGTFAILGLITALTSLFIESTEETEYQRYLDGHGPDDEENRPAVDFSISPSGVRATF